MSSPRPPAQHLLFCHLPEQIWSDFLYPQQGKWLFTVPFSQPDSPRTIESYSEVETRTQQFDHHKWMVAVADRWKGWRSVKMQRGRLFHMSFCKEPISTAPCTDLFVVWTHWKLTFLFHFSQHDNLSPKTLKELALNHIKKLTLISKWRKNTLSMERKEHFLFFHY